MYLKRNIRIIALIPLCAAAVCLAGCEKGSRLMIVENGVSAYTIVRPDNGSDAETAAAVKLKQSIFKVTGVDLDITTDWDGGNDFCARAEILVGRTNRARTAQVSLAENQYAIKVTDGQIVIAGGSDEALTQAVDFFLSEYLGYASDGSYTEKNGFGIDPALDVLSTVDMSARVAIFVTDESAAYAGAVRSGLKSAFTRITEYACGDSLSGIFDISGADLVAVIGANKVPAGTAGAVYDYMSKGGKVLTVGGPIFENILYPSDGGWLTEQEFLIKNAAQCAAKKEIIDLSDEKAVRRLKRSTNDASEPLKTEVGDFGLADSAGQFSVTIPNLSSWDVLNTGFDVPEGSNAVGFWAKGDEVTTGLYVELFEKDGSRWYAVAPLTTGWRYFILTSADFTIWDSPSRAGTNVDIGSARSIQFGLAMSGQSVSPGAHTYYIADLCTLSYTPPDTQDGKAYSIDGMTPLYELYPVANGASIAAGTNQVFVKDEKYTLPADMFSCSPGRQATGYGKDRISRFVPLIEVYDEKGLRSGYAAWMYIFFDGTPDLRGSMYAAFSANDAAFYDAAGVRAVCDAASAMLSGAYIAEGGTDEYIYVRKDTGRITAGAAIASAGDDAEVKVTLYGGGKVLAKNRGTAADMVRTAGGYYKLEFDYAVSGGLPDRVVTELYTGGTLADRTEHGIVFWEPKPGSERRYIYTENGCFMRDGQILNLFGINYMPSSGVAENNGALFEHYVSAASYDPDVFYNDLLRVREIGFNCVSIFVYYDSMKNSNNILHLIDMCEKLGLYVDLSIRPHAYPFSYDGGQVETMITRLHFPENDNIIAYDIAWEPMLGAYEKGVRKSLDPLWRSWIDDQYGSLSAAETAWGAACPRDPVGNAIGASDEMLDSAPGGRYDKLAAAYRRFIDDAIGYRFNITRRHILSLDPNHLISFRMSMAGSPSVAPSTYCYDFRSLGSTIDFMCPEGYALSAMGGSAYQALFANVYARYTNPCKPVVWKEYGKHVWSGSNFGGNAGGLEAQKQYYEAVLAEFYRGYTSALYCWFFPGGYRIGENSDYGIINPDGSDRPVTETLRRFACLFKAQGAAPEPDHFIKIERDDYPNGITGMYDTVRDELVGSFENGGFPAFVNSLQKDPQDIIYADEVTGYAVGNAKADKYPLRYVNGQIMNAETVTYGGQKYLRVTVTNTQDAVWRTGTVSLVSVSGVNVNYTFDGDIAYLGSVTADIPVAGTGETQLRFSVGGVLFGMKYTAAIE